MTWKVKESLLASAMMTAVVSTPAHAEFTDDLRHQAISNTLVTFSGPNSHAGIRSGEENNFSITDLATMNVAENSDVFPAIPSSLIWKGNLSGGVWDVSATANWNNVTTGNFTSVYNSGDNVTFDDSASNVTVTLNTFVTPSSVNFNANATYTLSGSGSIGGSTSIVKSGNGTLFLATLNSYVGGTFLNGGILAISADGDLGSSTGNLTFNGGTLAVSGNALPVFPAARNIVWTSAGGGFNIVNSSLTFTFDRNLSGGGLSKSGLGTLVLTANYTTTSSTIISQGTLQLAGNGTFSSGNILNSGTLAFNRVSDLTISSNISGTGGLSQIGTGKTIITGNYTATGPVSISAGKLTFAATTNTRQNPGVVLKMSSISIGSSSSLDVTNHDLIIGNTSYAAINNEILNTFNAGNGLGGSISSSTAAAGAPTFLVPIDAGAFGTTSFDNVAVDQPNSVIVKYDTFGDVNLDGVVDGNDIGAVETNFGQTTPGISNIFLSWLAGDVNFDGIVDGNDIGAVESNFGAAPEFATALSNSDFLPTPEPTSFTLISLITMPLLTRHRRK